MEWEEFVVEQITRIDFNGELFDHYAVARKVDNTKILRGFSGYQLYRDGTTFGRSVGSFKQVSVGTTVWISDHGGVSSTHQ